MAQARRKREGEALGHGGQFLEVLLHEFDPMHEAGGVGDLDGQPRAGVELQEQRPPIFVDDHIDPQVTEPGHVKSPGSHEEHLFPMGHLDAADRVARIRVVSDHPGTVDRG